MRSLQTAFIVTVAAVVICPFVLNGHAAPQIVAILFIGLSAMLGASVFGSEFNERTMGFWLTQPLSRRRLWWEKMMVLGPALIIAWMVMLLSICLLIRDESWLEIFPFVAGGTFLAILVSFCSAQYLTLSCRNFIGGVALTLILPWALWLVAAYGLILTGKVLQIFLPSLNSWIISHPGVWIAGSIQRHPNIWISMCELIYCAVMYWLGYRKFQNFQDANTRSRELSLPASLETWLGALVRKIIPGYTGPMASLIRKELQVQRATFLVAVVLGVLIFCARAIWLLNVKHLDASDDTGSTIGETAKVITFVGTVLYLVCVPLIAGLVSIAEERNWGTVAWQLTLPVSSRKQSLVKLITTYFTVVCLGVAVPLLVVLAMVKLREVIMEGVGPGDLTPAVLMLGVWILSYFLLLSLVMFASSLSTNTMRATVFYFGLLIAAGVITGLVGRWAIVMIGPHPMFLSAKVAALESAWNMSPLALVFSVDYGVAILFLCAVLLLTICLILKNYQTSEVNSRRRWAQSSVLVAALAGSAVALIIFINVFEAAARFESLAH